MESGTGEFSKGIISGPWFKLCDRLGSRAPVGYKLHPSALKHALAECGWVDIGPIRSIRHTREVHAICTPEMKAAHTKSELRDIIALPDTGLKIIK